MDKIAAIIVHYNTDKDTKEALRSLKKVKTSGFNLEIVIVDNGSKEHLNLSEKDKQGVHYLRSEINLGFTGGNNIGIKYSIENFNPEYFLLINSDTILSSDFLIKLYQFAQKTPQAGLINPKIYFYQGYEFHKNYRKEEEGKVIWYAGGVIDWDNVASFHKGVDEVDRGQFDKNEEVDFATGCCVLIKRQVFEIVGALNERLFLYGEDVDFSLRASRVGYKSYVVSNSHIWHKNAGSSDGAGSVTSIYYQTRNRLYIGLKYGHLKAKINTLRLMYQLISSGNSTVKKAVFDLVMRRFGKRAII